MFNPNSDMSKKLQEAPQELKKLLADILTESILNSNIPEQSKIEVRIMKAFGELDELLTKTAKHFGCPIPCVEEELCNRVYPARQAFLEYLQLTKAGLEDFLANVPLPDIPPMYLERLDNPFDRN